MTNIFVDRKFIRQDAVIYTLCLDAHELSKFLVVLDKQDVTAISVNIDHYCLRISEVGMDHIA